jgi:transposase-like protein
LDWKVGFKEMFLQEVTERSRRLVKELLEECIAKEFRGYIQASRYERRERRQDYRNGYRTRALMTTWGAIEDEFIYLFFDGIFVKVRCDARTHTIGSSEPPTSSNGCSENCGEDSRS